MSAPLARPRIVVSNETVSRLRDDLRISVLAPSPDVNLFAAEEQAERGLDAIYRSMNLRVDMGLPAANETILGDLRFIAQSIETACDLWEFERETMS